MDTKALAAVIKGIAPIVHEYVLEAGAELGARVKALEDRAPVVGPAGPAGPVGPAGERGEKGDAGERGADGAPGVAGERGERGEPGLPGERGEKGDSGEPGARGADGTPGTPGDAGARGEQGPAGEPGADGKDGRDGRDGIPGLQGEKGIDGINGKDGRDGIDGLGFDDLEVEFDGERSFTFKFVQGERVKAFGPFKVPATIYRGVYQHGKSYERGDSVTFGGASWIAMADTDARPGGAEAESRSWQLAVKKGADGRQGPPGPRGEFVTVKAGS